MSRGNQTDRQPSPSPDLGRVSSAGMDSGHRYLIFDGGALDTHEHILIRRGEALYLTPKTFETLRVLMNQPGSLVSKEELLETVWQGSVVTDNALTRVIKEIRHALGDSAREPHFVETVPRLGYRFLPPVKVQNDFDRPVPRSAATGYSDSGNINRKSGSRWHRVVFVILALALALALAAMVILWRPSTHSRPPTGLLAPHVTPEAYLEYAQGRELVHSRIESERRRAVNHFHRAIELDPNYPEAYSGLADALFSLGTFLPPKAIIPDAAAAIRKALELEPENLEARVSLAQLDSDFFWSFDAAEQGFRQALEDGPDYLPAYRKLALLLVHRGRISEAIELLESARTLAPMDAETLANLGWAYLMSGQTSASQEILDAALLIDPQSVLIQLNLGLLALKQNNPLTAVEYLEIALRRAGQSPDLEGLLGYALALAGDTDQARAHLAVLRTRANDMYVTPMGPALILLGLQEPDAAITELEAAYGDRNWHMLMLRHHFLFDELRSHPRFAALVEAVENASAVAQD